MSAFGVKRTSLDGPALSIGGLEHPVDLARHDKIVLVSPLIFLVGSEMVVEPKPKLHRGDGLRFQRVTHLSNKAKRFLKIVEVEGSFDGWCPHVIPNRSCDRNRSGSSW